MPKRIMSLRSLYLRVIALAGNTAFEEMSQQWRAVGNTVFDVSSPRFEPLTVHCRDKRVAA